MPPSRPPDLILIGLRGSGKSTVGRMVAARTGRPFIDLDDLTPPEMGCASIAEAWSTRGETEFRAAEVRVLRAVLARSEGIVLALGGGTPTAPGATELLQEHRARTGAVIVYLRAGADLLRKRLRAADNTHRPALTPGATDPFSEVETVLAQRDPSYLALADVVTEVVGLDTDETAAILTELVR